MPEQSQQPSDGDNNATNGFYFPMEWQTEGYVTQELMSYDRV
jgi:hypothetical protein